METIIALLCLGIGFFFGFVYHKLIERPVGRIIVHTDDLNDGPYLLTELYDVPETLYEHKRVVFDVTQK